jgi:CRISPR-associated endonuclease Csn1
LKVGGDDKVAKRCVVLSGQTTAFLRARWGLLKIRGDSDRHHALDAAVVAACSHGMVKRLADYARSKELEKVREGFPDPETGEIVDPANVPAAACAFSRPLAAFPPRTRMRVCTSTIAGELREELERFGTYRRKRWLVKARCSSRARRSDATAARRTRTPSTPSRNGSRRKAA